MNDRAVASTRAPVSTWRTEVLHADWRLARSHPGGCSGPDDIDGLEWRPAITPGTVAMAVGPDAMDGHPDYDAYDWWYACHLPSPQYDPATERVFLRFEGLATLVDVWLNGVHLLSSENMFRSHRVDVTDHLCDPCRLVLRFRSLREESAKRRPRPKWKTALVDDQSLRWFRTTLLGRIPGWTPRIRAVGPWRPVSLEIVSVLDVPILRVQGTVAEGVPTLSVSGRLEPLADSRVETLSLRVGGSEVDLPEGSSPDEEGEFSFRVSLPDAPLWWPHTHGEPALTEGTLVAATSLGPVEIPLGRLGFRSIEVDREDGRVRYRVNGVDVFCRGSCWTNADIVSLVGTEESVDALLRLAVEAGANMLRVGGTMVYESDHFYDVCDELGIMVWQDFMFANMDYPAEDADFLASAIAEVEEQLVRLAAHPSVVTYCGSSEIEQQAAMLGVSPDIWDNDFFRQVIPARIGRLAPNIPYWPSTPTEGVFPFYVGEGIAHYFGVGAYRKPLIDVRTAGVKFSPECLGFSNVPGPEGTREVSGGGAIALHHPDWKRGVPRDTGAGWDFEDVRDHYFERIYRLHPVELRSDDPTRYLELSRAVTGRVMACVFDEWRAGDECGGGLTWFFRDFRPGAGWGFVDSSNRPKPAYWHLRRAWAPQAVRLLDRGLDGVQAVVYNDGDQRLSAELSVQVISGTATLVESHTPIALEARARRHLEVDQLIGYFLDTTYSYRFGPPQLDAVVARLVNTESGDLLSEAVLRPHPDRGLAPAAVAGEARRVGMDAIDLVLESDRLAVDVRVDVRDFRPNDDYFDLTPGRPRTVRLKRIADSGRPFRGYVEGLNLEAPVRLPPPSDG